MRYPEELITASGAGWVDRERWTMTNRSGEDTRGAVEPCGRGREGGERGRRARAILRCRYSDRDLASGVHEAILPDNQGYVTSYTERSSLVAMAESDSLRSLRATLDDLLACIGTAERVMKPDPGPAGTVVDHLWNE